MLCVIGWFVVAVFVCFIPPEGGGGGGKQIHPRVLSPPFSSVAWFNKRCLLNCQSYDTSCCVRLCTTRYLGQLADVIGTSR
jgi:hypothetical protein